MTTKVILLIILLFSHFINAFAQPVDYYDGTEGLAGEELKNKLHSIIRGHTSYTYSEVKEILRELDEDPENPENVILIYSRRSISKNDFASNNQPDFWNREHVWPKSHGFPEQSDTAYTDVHHLRPCDASVNTSKSDKDLGFVNLVSANEEGEAQDTFTDSDLWEPSDEVKGDVARMIFYMATRYNSSILDLEVVNAITSSQNPELGILDDLLLWHHIDTVSDQEITRNEGVYAYQGNRNPFIDNPEWVAKIWGTNTGPMVRVRQKQFDGNFGKVPFGQSKIESYFLKSYNLSEDLVVTIDKPFSVSINNVDFVDSLVITAENRILDQQIFVKVEPEVADGLSYSQNIVHSSAGAELNLFPVSFVEGNLDMVSIESARNLGSGETVFVTGVVIGGPNNSAQNRTIHDGTAGVVVTSSDDENQSGLLNIGDSVNVTGTLIEDNGLLQIAEPPITIELIANNSMIPEPQSVNILQIDESYESELIRFENVRFTETGIFAGGESGPDYFITNGTNTFRMKLGLSSHPLVSTEIPRGKVNVTGYISQDASSYIIYPRGTDDIEVIQPISIDDARSLELGSEVFVTGVIIAGENNSISNRILYDGTAGIVVRGLDDGNESSNLVYGDSVSVSGTLSDFNGTLQISESPVTIDLIKQGVSLEDVQELSSIDLVWEDYESEVVRLPALKFKETDVFKEATNYTLTDGIDEVGFRLGIKDHPLVGTTIPTNDVQITGFVSEINGSYFIQPRSIEDLMVLQVTNSKKLPADNFEVYPIPSGNLLNIKLPFFTNWDCQLISVTGQLMKRQNGSFSNCKLTLENIPDGTYLLQVKSDSTSNVFRVIIK